MDWSRDKLMPLVKFHISKAGDEKWWNWRTCSLGVGPGWLKASSPQTEPRIKRTESSLSPGRTVCCWRLGRGWMKVLWLTRKVKHLMGSVVTTRQGIIKCKEGRFLDNKHHSSGLFSPSNCECEDVFINLHQEISQGHVTFTALVLLAFTPSNGQFSGWSFWPFQYVKIPHNKLHNYGQSLRKFVCTFLPRRGWTFWVLFRKCSRAFDCSKLSWPADVVFFQFHGI